MKNTDKNELTNTMIELMKTCGNDWKKSWASNGINKNSDGIAYTGINQLSCMIASSNNGYSSNIWWTFPQLLKKFGKGNFDLKGQTATTLVRPIIKTNGTMRLSLIHSKHLKCLINPRLRIVNLIMRQQQQKFLMILHM